MIWLIGSKGMLGSDVEILLKTNKVGFLSTDVECDITDYNAMEEYVSGKKIDWLINCAAYTAVDRAEEEPEAAYRINRDGVCNITNIAKSNSAKLIHISTDYVFNGRKIEPYILKLTT